jgi:hypothetical protein
MQVDPAVLGGPDLRHVDVPELVGPGHPEVAGPAAPVPVAGALEQPVGAHHPLHPLAVHRLAELTGRQRGDHPRPIGRVALRDLDDRVVAGPPLRPSSGRASTRHAVQRLPGHTRDPRHSRWSAPGGDDGAGPGHPDAHGQSRESSPAISNS